MSNYKIFTDGGSRGNPGPAAGGVVIFDHKGKLVKIDAKYFGKLTNNQAEYKALILALQILNKMKAEEIICYLDSELIVRQMNGKYKVKNNQIKKYKKKIDSITKNFKKAVFMHVPREKNSFADKLVNIVLDSRKIV